MTRNHKEQIILKKLQKLENSSRIQNQISIKDTICKLVLKLAFPYAIISAVLIVSMLCLKDVVNSGELKEIIELLVEVKEIEPSIQK